MKDMMKVYFCFLVLLVVALFATEAESFEVVLKRDVVINDNCIWLKDVVDAKELLNCEVLDIKLCRAPQPGKKRQLSRAFIAMKLKNKKVDTSTLSFNGAMAVNIEREAFFLKRESIVKRIKEYLADNYGVAKDACKVDLENISEDVLLPAGEVNFRLNATNAGYANGKVTFWLNVFVNDKKIKQKMISAIVKELQLVAVAKDDFLAHEWLCPDKLKLERKYVDNSDKHFSDLNVLKKYRARYLIRAGSVLGERNIALRPIVQKGAVVRAVLNSSCIEVELKLEVKEDGGLGEIVKAYSQTLKKHFNVKVISESKVEVLG